MLQIICRLHLFFVTVPIYGFGLMLVAAFLACVELAKFLAPRSRIDPELFVNAGIIALVAGVVGARLSHILENLGDYTNPHLSIAGNLRNMINIREGGLTFYGGFLLATPCCIAYAIRHKIPVKRGMDIVAICLMIGLGFGRIGCFLNGCCYGEQCTVPWGVRFPYYSNAFMEQYAERKIPEVPAVLEKELAPGHWRLLHPEEIVTPDQQAAADSQKALAVHPTELYSSFTNFLLAGLLLCYFTLPHVEGHVFALMLMLEGFSRYVLEMIRVEPPVFPHLAWPVSLMSISMILGMSLVVMGGILWRAFGTKKELEPQMNTDKHR